MGLVRESSWSVPPAVVIQGCGVAGTGQAKKVAQRSTR